MSKRLDDSQPGFLDRRRRPLPQAVFNESPPQKPRRPPHARLPSYPLGKRFHRVMSLNRVKRFSIANSALNGFLAIYQKFVEHFFTKAYFKSSWNKQLHNF